MANRTSALAPARRTAAAGAAEAQRRPSVADRYTDARYIEKCGGGQIHTAIFARIYAATICTLAFRPMPRASDSSRTTPHAPLATRAPRSCPRALRSSGLYGGAEPGHRQSGFAIVLGPFIAPRG